MRAFDVGVANFQPKIPSPKLNSYSCGIGWPWQKSLKPCHEPGSIDVLLTVGVPKLLEKHAVGEDKKGRQVELRREGR